MKNILSLLAGMFLISTALVAQVAPPAAPSLPVLPTITLKRGILLNPVFAIGGETTGIALQTSSGVVELVLPADLRKNLEGFSSTAIGVAGVDRILHGLETGDRKAIDVKKIVLWAERDNILGKLSFNERDGSVDQPSEVQIQAGDKTYYVIVPLALRAQARELNQKLVRATGKKDALKEQSSNLYFFAEKLQLVALNPLSPIPVKK